MKDEKGALVSMDDPYKPLIDQAHHGKVPFAKG